MTPRVRPRAATSPPGPATPLERNTVGVGKHGAQRFVAGDDVVERRAQRLDIQRAADPKRGRHVVGRSPALEPVEEPQPALGERQRNHRGPLTGHQRLTPTRLPADVAASWATVGASNKVCTETFGVQAGVDRGDQAHRRQRVPAQVEERVVDADPLDAEHLGVDAGQDLLDRVGRGAVVIAVGIFGCG